MRHSSQHSCGMYDYSGQFAFTVSIKTMSYEQNLRLQCKVGLPAKSGVCGCLLVVIPNVMGMAIWSPPLDQSGNSVRGIEFCKVRT